MRLLSEIERSRNASLDRWIIVLGLPGVGKTGAEQLADELQTLSDLVDLVHRPMTLSILGTATVEQVKAHLALPEVREMLNRLAKISHLR